MADSKQPFAPYEEIQEKKTTKLGYLLLIIMVVLGVSQGQGFIDSFARNIKSPQSISSCSYYLKSLISDSKDYNNYSYNYYSNDISNCAYSSMEIGFGIINIIESIKPLSARILALQEEEATLQTSSNQLQNKIETEKQNYDITLQEKMAGENSAIYDKKQIQIELVKDEKEYLRLQSEITQKQTEISATQENIKNIVLKREAAINQMFDEYKSEVKWVEFKRALLQLLLITPVLYFSSKKYFKQKRENSQYTIIWGAITFIFAILFAEVFLAFIYKIIPHELIQKLLEFFGQFAFFVTIIHYLFLLLTPAIFGGVVYLIQKKIYNKEAVMIRALKNHKCPSCNMNIREQDRYCPVCHYQIKEKCSACNNDRIVSLKFCPNCGVGNEN